MQESTLIELQSDNWLIMAIFLSKGKQWRELWLTGWKGKVEGGEDEAACARKEQVSPPRVTKEPGNISVMVH